MILSELNPTILIIGGAAIFSILVFFIIMFIFFYQRRHHKHLQEKQQLQNSYQREILKTQLEARENTFHQISEELHDNIGQLLSSTRMLLGIAERSLTEVPDTLRTADQTLAKAIQDLRMLSKTLNREWLHQFNLPHNLRSEIERINAAQTLEISFDTKVTNLPISAESQVMLFRIIQEALQNCIKHSKATRVNIILELNDSLKVVISDNGKGIQPVAEGQEGVGLINMKHRTSLLGGTIDWSSDSKNGTRVTILLPVQTEKV